METSLALGRMLMEAVRHGRMHGEGGSTYACGYLGHSFSSISVKHKEQAWSLLTLTELL